MAELREGGLFGRYRLERRLGGGGFAEVWLARAHAKAQPVAIKIAATAQGREALEREAEAHARLRHDAIVPLLEVNLEHAPPFVVMPWLEGGSLRERIAREGALLDRGDPTPAYRVMERICGALAYAHAEGVAHLDLKPENVLFDRDGRAWVADFGCAATGVGRDRLERSVDLATRDDARGTPLYLAPELLDGALADPSCDVYGLAALWFEMLCGERPQGASAPSQLVRGLGPIEDVIFLGCYTARAHRPADAGALLARLRVLDRARREPGAGALDPEALLRWWREGADPHAFPETPASRRVALRRRRRAIVAIALLLLVAGLFVGKTVRVVDRGGAALDGRFGTEPRRDGPRVDVARIIEEARRDAEEKRRLLREADRLIGEHDRWSAVRAGLEAFVARLEAPRFRYVMEDAEPWVIWRVRRRDGKRSRLRLVDPETRRRRAEELAEVRDALDRLALDDQIADWAEARRALLRTFAALGKGRCFAYRTRADKPWVIEASAREIDEEQHLITLSASAWRHRVYVPRLATR